MTIRCGYIAILGEPNVGKSTLINQLVGYKVSIVNHKVQTTRRRILGIYHHNDTQAIFVDTPGIFQSKKDMEKAMVKTAWNASFGADALLIVIPPFPNTIDQHIKLIEKAIKQVNGKVPVYVAINKIDVLIKKSEQPVLLDLATKLSSIKEIKEVFMISALQGQGVERVLDVLCKDLPEGPWLYDKDDVTDLPQKVWAAEITREKLITNLHEELPYQTIVETDSFETFENGDLKIYQTIYVAKDNQKSIVLGQKGSMIKRIGQQSRKELEYLTEKKVHLFLHVKVMEDWMSRQKLYGQLGIDS